MASGDGGLPDTTEDQDAVGLREVADNSASDLEPPELAQAHPSPQLSRRTLDELGQTNEDADDPENYPLYSSWAFWFERSPRGATSSDFFANLRQICVVKTIKAFWCVFNNLTPVDQLNERESYHLMRGEGRRPVWEDELNAHGGIWSFKMKKEDTATIWQEVLLAAVGEQFSATMGEGDDVCGVSVRIRGFDQNTIQIWNQESEMHSKSSVIQKIKELIPDMEINEFYQSNRSKMQDSLRKPMYGHGHRRYSPPPGGRYTGAPPPMQPPMFMGPPYPPGPPRYPAYPRYRHPPPIHNRPYPHSRPPYPAP